MIDFSSIRNQIQLSLYHVEKASYRNLNIKDLSKPYWVVTVVLKGNVQVSTYNVNAMARDGDVIIHPPDIPFSEHSDGEGTHLYMLMELKLAERIDFFRLYPMPKVLSLLRLDEYVQTFEALLTIWMDTDSPLRELRATSFTMLLISQLLESWQAAGKPERSTVMMTQHDRFIKVIEYMYTHFHEKISRDDLAELIHLHPSYFSRVFTQTYGVSSKQMLQNLRMKHALQSLENSESTLEMIAMRCGFGDAAYFSRVFKSKYRMTPGEYRKSIKSTKKGYLSSL